MTIFFELRPLRSRPYAPQRWRPFSIPADPVDFVRGLFTICGAGRYDLANCRSTCHCVASEHHLPKDAHSRLHFSRHFPLPGTCCGCLRWRGNSIAPRYEGRACICSSAQKDGFAIHVYTASTPMTDSCLANADGDMLIVPQQGVDVGLLVQTLPSGPPTLPLTTHMADDLYCVV